jgi:urease accessory protein
MRLAVLLQLADSAFPSGAFSHSFGLETAIVEGRVTDETTLEDWLRGYLFDSFATLEGGALALVASGRASARACDEVVGAATFAEEVRNANGRIARAMLDTFAAMGAIDEGLDAYREALRSGDAHGVAGIAFGLACAAHGIDERAGVIGYGSAQAAALAAVGTRAAIVGQRAAARILWRLRPALDAVAAVAAAIAAPEDLHAQAIDQEIDAMRHRLLDGRLFAS